MIAARAFARGAFAGLVVLGLCPALVAPGCGGPLPPLVGTVLQGFDDFACAAAAAVVSVEVPAAAPLTAFACQGEEQAVAAAIAHAEAQTSPVHDGGSTPKPPVALAVPIDAGAAHGPLLYRGGKAIGACPCGYPPHKQALAQAHLDAMAQDGGAR